MYLFQGGWNREGMWVEIEVSLCIEGWNKVETTLNNSDNYHFPAMINLLEKPRKQPQEK